MSNKKVKLIDCCISISDGDHQPPPKQEQGVPFITISNFDSINNISFDDCMFVSEEYYNSLPDMKRAQKGDILYSVVGSFGIPILIRENVKFVFQRHIAILRPNREIVLPEYLYYLLLNPDFYRQAEKYAIGAAQRTISLDSLRNMDVSIHSLDEQNKIVKQLESIDKKIINNRKINDNLDAQTKLIYERWFVQFDFPDKNGKPYKSAGGSLCYNEVLGTNIPEKWTVTRLGNICECLLGGTPRRDEPLYWNGNINWITSGKVNEFRISEPSEKITDLGYNNTSTYLLPKNTTVLAITGATMGQVSILNIDACANQSVVGVLENDTIKTEFIYHTIITSLKGLLNQKAGAAQPHINKENIKEINFALPSASILKSYYDMVHPLFEKILKNESQNMQLVKLRDWLLPMLMNGQATIDD